MPFLNTNKSTTPAGSFKQIPFWRLRAKYRECGLFDEEVAAAAGLSLPTMSRRMRGAAPWLSSEIAAVCGVVGITQDQIGAYFFPDVPEKENAPAETVGA